MVHIPDNPKQRVKRRKQRIQRDKDAMRAVLTDKNASTKQVLDVLRQIGLLILDELDN